VATSDSSNILLVPEKVQSRFNSVYRPKQPILFDKVGKSLIYESKEDTKQT